MDADTTSLPLPGDKGPIGGAAKRLVRWETAIAMTFAVVTFIAYWYLGPQQTAYSYQVSQANNILNGHLDLREQDSKNLGVLERVLYDGERFCLPAGDEAKLPEITEYNEAIAAGKTPEEAAAGIISPNCKLYMQHSLGPSFMMMPGVLIWGKELNQTLVSCVIGALTAIIVYLIARKLSRHLLTQVALTAMMIFGTIFWWVASNGGVWFFAHTTAVFFLFGAIYFTVVRRNPLLAGVFLGAAYLSRPTVIMGGLFFVIMFSDLWLKPRIEALRLSADGPPVQQSWWSPARINWAPVFQFAGGILPFVLFAAFLNFVRYDNPLEYGYNYVESSHQVFLAYQYRFGNLDIRYMDIHPPVIFGGMPVIQQNGPWVVPTYFGMAIWITTPAWFIAFFANIKKYIGAVIFGAGILALASAFMLSRAIAAAWQTGWATQDLPFSIQYAPFWIMIAVGLSTAIYFRDKVSVACWSAILPIGAVLFAFAFVGYAQFGYRYALDFSPFLWLLVAHAIGDRVKWYHLVLIALGIAVNLAGVLWIYQFEPNMTNGWSWVTF